MKPDFNLLHNRRDSDSKKWNIYDEDILPLWVADTDFLSPPTVIDALKERITHGIFGYSKPSDSTKESIQRWLQNRHNWAVALEDIILIPGVVQGFNIAAKAFSNPGDSVLIQTPAYHPFFHVAENSSLEQISAPISQDPDGNYLINETHLTSTIQPQTRVFMLCNPQNPTGRVFSKPELQVVAQICIENNIIICSDEIHSDLVFPGNKHIPIATLSGNVSDITVTLISASKTFNISGLKSSAAIITNQALREQFASAATGFVGSVNLLGELALRTSYDLGEVWLEHLLTYLESNRNQLVEIVNADLPGIQILEPEGTYLGWLNCTDLNLEDPAKFFLEKASVAVNSGTWFGKEYRQYIRLNFGCPQDRLLMGLERIKNALHRGKRNP